MLSRWPVRSPLSTPSLYSVCLWSLAAKGEMGTEDEVDVEDGVDIPEEDLEAFQGRSCLAKLYVTKSALVSRS